MLIYIADFEELNKLKFQNKFTDLVYVSKLSLRYIENFEHKIHGAF